jgi:hypothetical protein
MKFRVIRKKRCAECGSRRPRFKFRGRVKCDRQHNLCPRCFRSIATSVEAALRGAAGLSTPTNPAMEVR